MIKNLRFPVIERKEIAKDTYEIRFGIEGTFDYKAGQYVTVKIDKKVTDGRGALRAFSLSSSPNNKKYISTCFRLPNKHSDYKEYLVKCKKGTIVTVDGPKGKFILPKSLEKPLVMIAGGVGITPFIGMIRYSTDKILEHEIKLIYTDKSEDRMAYFDELVKLEAKNKNFRFSNRFKRVDAKYLKQNCDVEKSLFYICGTPGMVKGVTDILIGLGVNDKRIFFEEFSGY